MSNQMAPEQVMRNLRQQARQRDQKSVTTANPARPIAASLQRTLGNQALGRLAIQTKLTLGPAGDAYEQEADQVAKQVVQQIDAPTPAPVQSGQTAQRQNASGMEEEEKVAAKRLPAGLQRATVPEEEEQMAAKRLSTTIQRAGALEEEEAPMQAARVQRAATVEGGPVSAEVEASIQSARGGGRPLHDGVRGAMEQSFGADFSGVNIHTGGQANALNQQVQARAFTTGKDIFFREGEYNPESRDGKELLAHELTHVVQQTGRG